MFTSGSAFRTKVVSFYRTKKLQAMALAFVFLSASLTPAHAQSSAGLQHPFPASPARELAVIAVRAIYTSDALVAPGDDFAWMAYACYQMISTASCSYFRSNQAGAIWNASQDVIGGVITNVSLMQQNADGSQLWKMTAVTYTRQYQAHWHLVVIRAVYDNVRHGWMLDRLLYGPYINP